MNAYRRLWWLIVIPLAALGAAEALLVVPPRVAWTAGIVGGVLSGVCRLGHLSRDGQRPAPAGAVAAVAGCGAVVSVVVSGLSVLLGGAALLLLMAACCLHPRVVVGVAAQVRRWLHLQPGPAEAQPVRGRPGRGSAALPSGGVAWRKAGPHDEALPATPMTESFVWPDTAAVRRLSTAQLCWGWRTSFAALERARHDHPRWTALVAVRRRYLDEIARRDPAGLARWLYAGARPASDPSRYLLATDAVEPEA